MAISRIEIDGELPHYSVRAEFDGVIYSLRFRWNDRAARWTVDLLDDSEAECLVAGWPLDPVIGDLDAMLEANEDLTAGDLASLCVFGRYFLPGVLVATSTEQLTTQEGLSAVELVYYDQATMAEIAASDDEEDAA